eukprot:s5495_g2.t1
MGENAGKFALMGCGLVCLGLLIFVIVMLASIKVVNDRQQKLGHCLVKNGPVTEIVWPHISHEVREAVQVSTSDFAVLKHERTQELRHVPGPEFVFMGAYESLEAIRSKTVLQKQEYVRLVDKMTGEERVVQGATTLVPRPLEDVTAAAYPPPDAMSLGHGDLQRALAILRRAMDDGLDLSGDFAGWTDRGAACEEGAGGANAGGKAACEEGAGGTTTGSEAAAGQKFPPARPASSAASSSSAPVPGTPEFARLQAEIEAEIRAGASSRPISSTLARAEPMAGQPDHPPAPPAGFINMRIGAEWFVINRTTGEGYPPCPRKPAGQVPSGTAGLLGCLIVLGAGARHTGVRQAPGGD